MEEWYESDMHIHFGQVVVNMHLLRYSSSSCPPPPPPRPRLRPRPPQHKCGCSTIIFIKFNNISVPVCNNAYILDVDQILSCPARGTHEVPALRKVHPGSVARRWSTASFCESVRVLGVGNGMGRADAPPCAIVLVAVTVEAPHGMDAITVCASTQTLINIQGPHVKCMSGQHTP